MVTNNPKDQKSQGQKPAQPSSKEEQAKNLSANKGARPNPQNKIDEEELDDTASVSRKGQGTQSSPSSMGSKGASQPRSTDEEIEEDDDSVSQTGKPSTDKRR